MNIVYIHSSYKPNDLIGQWFSAAKEMVEKDGGKAYFAIKYVKGKKIQEHDIMVGDSISCKIHSLMFDCFGLQDMFSWFATKRFLKKLDKIHPEVIHLHVANDWFLNMGLLCNYINKHNIKAVWTFHDARVMTGCCPCPVFVGCEEWQRKCEGKNCSNTFIVPTRKFLYLIGITHNYRKKTIGRIKNLTIVTPSKWMSTLVEKSYLKNKPCVVINNGINLDMFHPVEQNVREKYGISPDKKILLSVGNPIWELKGRSFLHRLFKDLPDKYYFIWIGCIDRDVDSFKDCDRISVFPRVDREELLQFYTAADLFVNPTLADNFPTVNLECQACGTPVVAFDSEGTKETVAPNAGVVVPRKDYEALRDAILNFAFDNAGEKSREFALQFDQKNVMPKYFNLYNSK